MARSAAPRLNEHAPSGRRGVKCPGFFKKAARHSEREDWKSPRNDVRHEIQDSKRPHAVASRIVLDFGQRFHKQQDVDAEAANCPSARNLLPAAQRQCAENLAHCELPCAYRVRTIAC